MSSGNSMKVHGFNIPEGIRYVVVDYDGVVKGYKNHKPVINSGKQVWHTLDYVEDSAHIGRLPKAPTDYATTITTLTKEVTYRGHVFQVPMTTRFLATDHNGFIYAYETEPRKGGTGWIGTPFFIANPTPFCPEWKESLVDLETKEVKYRGHTFQVPHQYNYIITNQAGCILVYGQAPTVNGNIINGEEPRMRLFAPEENVQFKHVAESLVDINEYPETKEVTYRDHVFQIPLSYRFLATNFDSAVYAYATEPKARNVSWITPNDAILLFDGTKNCDDWRESLVDLDAPKAKEVTYRGYTFQVPVEYNYIITNQQNDVGVFKNQPAVRNNCIHIDEAVHFLRRSNPSDFKYVAESLVDINKHPKTKEVTYRGHVFQVPTDTRYMALSSANGVYAFSEKPTINEGGQCFEVAHNVSGIFTILPGMCYEWRESLVDLHTKEITYRGAKYTVPADARYMTTRYGNYIHWHVKKPTFGLDGWNNTTPANLVASLPGWCNEHEHTLVDLQAPSELHTIYDPRLNKLISDGKTFDNATELARYYLHDLTDPDVLRAIKLADSKMVNVDDFKLYKYKDKFLAKHLPTGRYATWPTAAEALAKLSGLISAPTPSQLEVTEQVVDYQGAKRILPLHANYIAQDSDGEVYWYKQEPVYDGETWGYDDWDNKEGGEVEPFGDAKYSLTKL